MAAITVTPANVRIVEIVEKITAPAAEAILAGSYVRLNTTSGKLEYGNGSSATEVGKMGFIATRSVAAGEALTAMKKGILDIGEALASTAFDAQIFVNDTDTSLGDAAGTTSKVVGVVWPGWATSTANADKVLRVDM
jgi:predicted RecA/RadA family phage recombinase